MAAQEVVMSDASIEQLKELVDPFSLVSSLGFNIYYDNQDEIRAPCIIHGGDNKTAFCFRKNSKRFYCFTHGCEASDGGSADNDVIALVMKVQRCSFAEAVRYLSELTGFSVTLGSVDENELRGLKNSRDKKKFIKNVTTSNSLNTIDEATVQKYIQNGCSYFEQLGIDKSIIELFELGTMRDRLGVVRASIPIRDEFGKLVSISGRRVDGDEEPRYLLLKNFKKRHVLYNLHRVLNIIDECSGNIIIVEGFKALWHVIASGYPNVVAVMGKSVRQEQINLLVKYGFSCAILLLDGDKEGKHGATKSVKLMRGKIDNKVISLPDGLSPDDTSINDLYDLISMFV